MKIRTDFVTNSSSSSFVTLNADSKVLAKIFEKYQHLFDDEEYCCDNVYITDDSVEINIEEGYAEIPSSKKEIIIAILSAIGCEIYLDDYEDGETIKIDEDDFYGDESRIELYNEILANAKEIEKDIKHFDMTVSDIGWQGDSDSRYYEDNYDDETLKMYYEKIAEEKGCNVEDVTVSDFQEWVSDKVSTEENTYTYDAKTEKEEVSHSFTVE